jgi:hypothetical protein
VITELVILAASLLSVLAAFLLGERGFEPWAWYIRMVALFNILLLARWVLNRRKAR